MAKTLPDRFHATPRPIRSLRGEGPRTRCSPDDVRLIGIAIAAGLRASGHTEESAALELGYANHTMVARWISGRETANLAVLWRLGALFQRGFLLSLAQGVAGMHVHTTTTIFEERRHSR